MKRIIASTFAFILILALAGCMGSAPVAYSSTDLHTNAFLAPTVSMVRGMSVGLVHSRFHYARERSGMADGMTRKEETLNIQKMQAVFVAEVTRALRANAPFSFVDHDLKNTPDLKPVKEGRQSRQKFLLLRLSADDTNRAAGFAVANNLSAALTIDASIEHTVLQKQRYMVLRIDWIMIDKDGKELYNITTYNNAAIDDVALTQETVNEISALSREGARDFAGSIRAILKKG